MLRQNLFFLLTSHPLLARECFLNPLFERSALFGQGGATIGKVLTSEIHHSSTQPDVWFRTFLIAQKFAYVGMTENQLEDSI
ncbi:unnamed protein product [Linum trigynum]|uniref:Secreted protein n=1 Tax=Linum trigynum TaxID=586398 RepID=A0AAV2CD79_9ROSI